MLLPLIFLLFFRGVVSNDAYTDMDTRTMVVAHMPRVDIGRMGKDGTANNPNTGAPLRHVNGLFPAQSRAARPPGQACLDRYLDYFQRKGTYGC